MPDQSSEDIGLEEITLEAQEKMEKSLEALKRELATIRSTRASVNMVDHIQVEYYGAPVPMNQVATISVPEARMLMITPFDKSAMHEIEKAIQKSDLGITPQNDGSVIRLILPEMTMERRQELVKQVKHRLEETRVSVRNIRRDANDSMKKLSGKGHSEDEVKSGQEEIQKVTDEFIKKAEEIAAEKEESILKV